MKLKSKKIISLVLSFCMALSLTVVSVSAETQDTKLEVIRAMGIMTGDQNGNLNLSNSVTRAEFVKMMSMASVYKDSIGDGSGVSLFTDVKSSYWASEYIKLAIEKGWVYGYVDGSFRPGNTITLEEACTALLRMLGYSSADLVGSYPQAQLSKASSIGLRDDMSAGQGAPMSRQACVSLFYNLMVAENSQGQVYGSTLGYTINNDQVDYSSLVSNNMNGPYVADGTNSELSFVNSGTAVYKNGNASSISDIAVNDVYYYSKNMNTVWVYDKKISGTLTSVTPSTAEPSAVVVSGVTYQLGTSTAEYKCSARGSFKEGDVVTLLLGMNGDVVDIVSSSSASTVTYGVVIKSESTATSSDNTAEVQKKTTVVSSDGTERVFYHTGSSYRVGSAVAVTVNGSGTTISSASKSLSGAVSKDGKTFAGYSFADGVGIIDVDSYGGYKRIYPSRIAGYALSSDNVLYYALNSSKEITSLILKNVTGDTCTYGYITHYESSGSDMSPSCSGTYFANGSTQNFSSQSTSYGVGVGGAVFYYEDGQLSSMRKLEQGRISTLSGTTTARIGNTDYDIAENVVVLIKDGSNNVYATDIDSINTSDYTLTGWYDNLSFKAGKRIRVIVAVKE